MIIPEILAKYEDTGFVVMNEAQGIVWPVLVRQCDNGDWSACTGDEGRFGTLTPDDSSGGGKQRAIDMMRQFCEDHYEDGGASTHADGICHEDCKGFKFMRADEIVE